MIYLYKNYKYDNNYDYIKLFSSKEEQDRYFYSLDKILISEESYTKENKGTFIIDYPLDFLVNEGINYIMFNNGYKNIYAFVIQKDYIGDECTRIEYEIDVMQTYLFDFTINNSFIERKNCNVDEIVDYDEGIDLGEHIIEKEYTVFNKDSVYFAMFNGFKEQELIFDGKILKSVVDLPFSTSKPLTIVDGIQYPVYFMPLKETYKKASYESIGLTGSGETEGGTISAKLLRFIKGEEGMAYYPNHFNSESFRTGGYGITELYQKKYFDLLGNAPYTEQKATEVLLQMIRNEYANKIYFRMLEDGKKGNQIKQNHFDAFISLAMNSGIGGMTSSPMYKKWIVNADDTNIGEEWLTYAIKNEIGEDMEGLKDRRRKESNIFNDGIYEFKPIAYYNMNGNIGGILEDNNGHGYIPSNVNGGVE